jgi:subtilisin family serine protease
MQPFYIVVRLVGQAVLFLISLVVISGDAHSGIASLGKRWNTQRPLRVCFFGGKPNVREQVAKIANEWTDDTNIKFNFGPAPLFNDCDRAQMYDVRISFDRLGNWTYVGTDAKRVSIAEPTVNLQDIDTQVMERLRFTVLHQFGHVLGILHQEQDPGSDCHQEFDLRVLREFQASKKIQEEFFFAPDNGRYLATGFDRASVMRLFVDPALFKSGTSSSCYGPVVSDLSAGDRGIVRLLYPPRPPDVEDHRSVSVRLEGALAPQHYGSVLQSLNKAGKVQFKKHVPIEGPTVGDVIASENLAPKGIVTKTLEIFLCKTNPHICKESREIARWSNIPATINYRPDDTPCGSPALPKYIYCIPNVRLESSTFVATVGFNAKGESLSKIVVENLSGCENWNSECRSLIRSLNENYRQHFIDDDQLLPKSFNGPLKLPARSYRLVIQTESAEEQERIGKIVEQIVTARAQALRIPERSIGISITNSVGKPKSLGGKLYSEPITEYVQPLKAMGFPYKDETTEAELLTQLPAVTVAIWDTTVDESHCDLVRPGRRLIYRSLSHIAPAEKAPEAVGDCNSKRLSQQRSSERYDHGTHVAGVLAAQVNSKGIAGVNPGLRIWAWEVIEGSQFSKDSPNIVMKRDHPDLEFPKVINISQSYPISAGRPSDLQRILFGDNRLIQGLHNEMLIVAAAGTYEDDTGSRIGYETNTISECGVYPACWSNADGKPRAVISVVALNSRGDGLLNDEKEKPLSNYGQAFDVSAVGETVSTMHGNWFGVLRGSSFAAPYVTGLASLIYAKLENHNIHPKPMAVKQRILSSADILSSLKGVARFGRINFATALAFDRDIIEFKPSAECPDGCAILARIDRDVDESVRVEPGASDGVTKLATESKISFSNIRRLFRQDNDLFTIYYTESDRLKKLENAKLSMVSGAKIVVRENKVFSLDLLRLKNYVSCSFYPECPQ